MSENVSRTLFHVRRRLPIFETSLSAPMPLPKLVAAAVCVGVLATQLAVAFPPASERSWYWPFLPYPMYSRAHAQSDTLVVPQLRAVECGDRKTASILGARELGVPLAQLTLLLSTIAHVPESDAANRAKGKLGRVIEAQYPARFCEASAWARTVRIDDPSTYDLRNSMRRFAAWNVNGSASR